MNFYMGLFHLYQFEPPLSDERTVKPPIIAKGAARFVDHIGKIAAGLVADMKLANTATVSTIEGAVLVESCFPLLTAGIQMTDGARRRWVINYLTNVERVTGYRFAKYARDTCEAFWVKLALLGRGPPYNKQPKTVDSSEDRDWRKTKKKEEQMSSTQREPRHEYYIFELLGMSGQTEGLALSEGSRPEGSGILRSQMGSASHVTSDVWTLDSEKPQSRKRNRRYGKEHHQGRLMQTLRSCSFCRVGRLQCIPKHHNFIWDEAARRYKYPDPNSPRSTHRPRGQSPSQVPPSSNAGVPNRPQASSAEPPVTGADPPGNTDKSNSDSAEPAGRSSGIAENQDHRAGKDGGHERSPPHVALTKYAAKTELGPSSPALETDDSRSSLGESDDDSHGSDTKSEVNEDSAAMVQRILKQNKGRIVRHVVWYCRKIVGSRQLHGPGSGDGSNSKSQLGEKGSMGSRAGGPGESGNGIKKAESPAKGKGRRDENDGDDEDRDKRRPIKRSRVSVQETVSDGLKLACPYFKRNPKAPRIGQSCGGPGWNTIHRLKEHLYRRHVCVRCLRCGASFPSETDLVPHSRAPTACAIACTATDPDDGFEKHQEVLLRRRWKMVSTTEEQWRHLYKILFPDDSEDLMPSPYYQDHRAITDEFARFELFLRRETTRLLEERLNETLLDGSAALDPSSLAGQLSNVVNEIQGEAIRSYRESAQMGPSEDNARSTQSQVEESCGSSQHATTTLQPGADIAEILEETMAQEGSSDGLAMGSGDDIESWCDLLLSADSSLDQFDGEPGNWAEQGWEFPQ